jgi:hypothetical protein
MELLDCSVCRAEFSNGGGGAWHQAISTHWELEKPGGEKSPGQ